MTDKATATAFLGDLLAGGLLLQETQTLAEVMLKHPSPEEWKRLIEVENILQKNTVHTAKRVAIAVNKRMHHLGEQFWEDLLQADTDTCKQLILFSMLARSQAMVEYMTTVLSEARRMFQTELHISSWLEFFQTRARSVPGLDAYAEVTIKRMGNNVFRMLTDCGYLSEGRNKKLYKPFVSSTVSDWAHRLDRLDVLRAMES